MQSGTGCQSLCQMTYLGCSSGQINTVTVNIRCQFRGCSLQYHLYIINNGIKVLLQRLVHHSCGNLTLHRQTGDNVSAVYYSTLSFFFQFLQGNLHILSRLATDDQREFSSDCRTDGIIKFHAAHLDQTAQYDTAQ